MTKQLSNIEKSTERFITEARICASQELGFAAMLIIFPVILSVSEAIHRPTKISTKTTRVSDKELFTTFVPYMIDKSWLILRHPSPLSDHYVATELFHLRNSLAHQLSLPIHMGMVNIKSEATDFLRLNPFLEYVISVVDFVEGFSETIEQIIKTHPTAIFDPNPSGGPRSPGRRVIYARNSSGSSSGRE